MAHIYVYSPSSAIRDRMAFRRGLRRLQALGHKVELDVSASIHHMRFAGDDACRVAAIARAAASGADVALITRGGYGLTRILPDLPYDAIHEAVAGGMQFVGLSDFTAMQCAMLALRGTCSWAGPALGEDFGAQVESDGSPDMVMEACFQDLLTGQGEGAGWTLPLRRQNTPENIAINQDLTRTWGHFESISGVLWGGNLTVLCALVGTPWMPNIDGGILFLEDVGEHPYRIERMLLQLLHAGVLARQKAVLMGQFNRYTLVPGYDRGFRLETVFDFLRSKLSVPVLEGLPFGHVPTKVLLPVGREVGLSVQGREAMLYWGDD